MLILVTSSAAIYTIEWLKLDYMMKLRSSVECRDKFDMSNKTLTFSYDGSTWLTQHCIR